LESARLRGGGRVDVGFHWAAGGISVRIARWAINETRRLRTSPHAHPSPLPGGASVQSQVIQASPETMKGPVENSAEDSLCNSRLNYACVVGGTL
jgi:hypothetical protein